MFWAWVFSFPVAARIHARNTFFPSHFGRIKCMQGRNQQDTLAPSKHWTITVDSVWGSIDVLFRGPLHSLWSWASLFVSRDIFPASSSCHVSPPTQVFTHAQTLCKKGKYTGPKALSHSIAFQASDRRSYYGWMRYVVILVLSHNFVRSHPVEVKIQCFPKKIYCTLNVHVGSWFFIEKFLLPIGIK